MNEASRTSVYGRVADLLAHVGSFSAGEDGAAMDWEYHLVTARRDSRDMSDVPLRHARQVGNNEENDGVPLVENAAASDYRVSESSPSGS